MRLQTLGLLTLQGTCNVHGLILTASLVMSCGRTSPGASTMGSEPSTSSSTIFIAHLVRLSSFCSLLCCCTLSLVEPAEEEAAAVAQAPVPERVLQVGRHKKVSCPLPRRPGPVLRLEVSFGGFKLYFVCVSTSSQCSWRFAGQIAHNLVSGVDHARSACLSAPSG